MKTHTTASNALWLATGLLLLAATTGCSGRNSGSSSSDSSHSTAMEEFHADNDIAMTVRSVADAINVGEPLLAADYNFDGILTDGEGRPIYTNMHGLPGKWDIDAVTTQSVVIRNVEFGDLLVDDLESYITGEAGLSPKNLVDSLCLLSDDGGRRISVYDFGKGLLRFETHNSCAPNGLEAPLMIITVSYK